MINRGIVLYFTLSLGWFISLAHTGALRNPDTILSSSVYLHQSAKSELIDLSINSNWVGSLTGCFWGN